MTSTDRAERLESLKAGLTGAASSTIAFLSLKLLESGLASHWPALEPRLGLQAAIAAVSGFLFGVTYRYVIRQDANPQLKLGAIAAFGLVRGLAQLEGDRLSLGLLLSATTNVLDSLLLFAIAGCGLEVALRTGWVKPFGSSARTPRAVAEIQPPIETVTIETVTSDKKLDKKPPSS